MTGKMMRRFLTVLLSLGFSFGSLNVLANSPDQAAQQAPEASELVSKAPRKKVKGPRKPAKKVVKEEKDESVVK